MRIDQPFIAKDLRVVFASDADISSFNMYRATADLV
jgi:hypothetical protein